STSRKATPTRRCRSCAGSRPNTATPTSAGARRRACARSGRRPPGVVMHDIVDLRSDTLTLPTPEMRDAMARAEVGDDVWEEDPTVKRLEAMAAERTGKDAGLFVASGTQGNLLSVWSQTQPGSEVVLDLDCHIFNNEVAG